MGRGIRRTCRARARSAAAAVLLALAGCASAVPSPPLGPFMAGDLEPVHEFYRKQLEEGDPDSSALFLNGLAEVDLLQGDLDIARKRFEGASRIMNNWNVSGGEEVAAIVGSEGSKTWRGDPYEKAMNGFYAGLLYWWKGEPDNARAAFKRGIFADAESDEGDAQIDFALLYWLAGRASLAEGLNGDAEQFFADARKAREFAVKHGARGASSATVLTDPSAGNLVCVFELGLGPHKVAGGSDGELAIVQSYPVDVEWAEAILDGTSLGRSTLLADLDYQARTRGGRVMEGIRKGKAVFKQATGISGTVLLINGLDEGGSSGNTKAAIGGGLLLLSLLTRAEADTRTWETLPQSVHVLTANLDPGVHVLQVRFHRPGGAVIPEVRSALGDRDPGSGPEHLPVPISAGSRPAERGCLMKFRNVTAALLALFATACSSAGPMPAEGVPEGDDLSQYRERLADDLRGYIELEQPVLQRTEANLLRVSVPVRNISGKDLELMVQVDFVDALGAPSDSTNRRVFMIPRGTTKWFEVVSRTSNAHDYIMHVWRAP